jgi:hypothetical protein
MRRRSPLDTIARDAIARARRLPLALAALVACASGSGPGDALDPSAALGPAAPDALRVSLVFGADVDLDLYVTGPSSETVYFGNDASREGGRLVADRRCDSRTPRIETVEFAPAAPGRYRIGVDFMVRCARGVDRASYELYAERPGQPPLRQRGEAIFGAFAPRVLELEVAPPAMNP